MLTSFVDRDLDAAVAEEILGWTLADVGPDAMGENRCRILTEHGLLPDGFELPRLGPLHLAYLTPFYSSRWDEALRLAKRVGLDMRISELPSSPGALSRACLEHWRATHTYGRNPDGTAYHGRAGVPGSPPPGSAHGLPAGKGGA